MTKLLITGITGQDGMYLAEEARNQGMDVYGLVRGQDNPKRQMVVDQDIPVVDGDLTDAYSLNRAISLIRPNIVVNLGAITFIPTSWLQPELTFKVNALGVLSLLNACVEYGVEHFVQASTSEMFGNTGGFLNEESPMMPVSPYGISKLAAHQIVLNYRAAHRINAVSAIMFNHESPRRGAKFVTQKIATAAALTRLKLDNGQMPEPLELGNLDAKRDWGYSPEYMRGLLAIATRSYTSLLPSYVFATGETATVAQFAEAAYRAVNLDWQEFVTVNTQNMRVNELHELRGNAGRALRSLGWSARTQWHTLASLMTQAALIRARVNA